MAIVTCHTDGCASEGRGIELVLSGVDAEGQEWSVDTVMCGACSQQITDIHSV